MVHYAKVGNIANLDTTAKTSTVAAINEVQGEIEKFNLSIFKEYTQNSGSSDLTVSGGTLTNTSFNVARNSDGSIFKLYGNAVITRGNSSGNMTVTLKNTGITPSEAFNIVNAGLFICRNIGGTAQTGNGQIFSLSPSIAANGDISFTITSAPANSEWRLFFFPCLYFAKNFGDTPTPE